MRRLLKCDPKRLAGAMLRMSGALALIILFAFPAGSEVLNTVSPGKAETGKLLDAGWALFQDHKNDEAIATYSRAIDLDPQNARAFALRAWAFSRKRDKAHALEDAE
jgi:hypothetical protein